MVKRHCMFLNPEHVRELRRRLMAQGMTVSQWVRNAIAKAVGKENKEVKP